MKQCRRAATMKLRAGRPPTRLARTERNTAQVPQDLRARCALPHDAMSAWRKSVAYLCAGHVMSDTYFLCDGTEDEATWEDPELTDPNAAFGGRVGGESGICYGMSGSDVGYGAKCCAAPIQFLQRWYLWYWHAATLRNKTHATAFPCPVCAAHMVWCL